MVKVESIAVLIGETGYHSTDSPIPLNVNEKVIFEISRDRILSPVGNGLFGLKRLSVEGQKLGECKGRTLFGRGIKRNCLDIKLGFGGKRQSFRH